MTVPAAAAVEAATWALHGRSKNDPSGAMDGVCACHNAEEHDLFLAEDEAAAKLMLEAAAPYLAAAAWRDGYGQGRDDEAGGLPLATGEASFTAAADPTTETEGFRAYKAGLAEGRAEGAAAERDRLIRLAAQLRAAIPADHPEGAEASFADYLRQTEGDPA